MPRRDCKPSPDGGDQPRRRRNEGGEPARSDAEEPASFVGIPGFPDEVVPVALREAIARLAAERDRLRDELAQARGRITSLERLADEDSLTPVANRRAFVRQLTRMIAFTHRYGVPASVIYFDVNNMKHINDEHGHPAGDAALRHVATVLRDNVRASDIVGRLGGDEFGVILAHTNEAQAHHKATALALAIAQRPLSWEGSTIAITAAYGVYAFSGSDDPHHAIEAADRAMYEQKRATGHANA